MFEPYISAELAVALCLGDGHGEWGTVFVSIPSDTLEENILDVAKEIYLKQRKYSGDIARIWLYDWKLITKKEEK